MHPMFLEDSKNLVLRPAYGRTYATGKEMSKDWDSGKDFQIEIGGSYCSVRDITLMKQQGYNGVHIVDTRSCVSMVVKF